MNEKTDKTDKNGREAIPVAKLRFCSPTDIPGKSVADGLQAHTRDRIFNEKGERTGERGYLVDYRPWMRSFAVTYFPPGTGAKLEQVFVPETNVKVWEAQ
jgi:hypothetical protein